MHQYDAPPNTATSSRRYHLARGAASVTSMPTAPYGAPPAPGTSVADATTSHWQVTGADEV
jgi:hypothetical protein